MDKPLILSLDARRPAPLDQLAAGLLLLRADLVA